MIIYIIGSPGSGKTTLAKYLSRIHNILYYELDCVIYDDSIHKKRNNREIDKLFNNIINKKDWIIEDVGRDIFNKGLDKADIIYFINLNKILIYYRVISRWLKERMGKIDYNHPPTIKYLFTMLRYVKKYNKKDKLNRLYTYNNKLIILNKKDINKLERVN
jgi:adenylate kinase family enzyme